MGAIRGSATPITITVSGVDLTLATITMVFGRSENQPPRITKTTTAADIAVAYDAGTTTSTLTLTLSATDTAYWVGEVVYAIYVNDGTLGGSDWIPDNGGRGSITFENSVKKI